jgi:hypothetical protein
MRPPGTNHVSLAGFVLTPTHEDRARPISYNQIDRYKWRILYDAEEV